MSISLFTVGSLVNVEPEERVGRPDSTGGQAWITKVVENEVNTFEIQYPVENQVSVDVVIIMITNYYY